MNYARHVALLRQPQKDGATRRAHLEAAAARGHQKAIAALAGPPFPDALAGLWEVFLVLDGMRPLGFHGPERFTPAHIAAANGLFGWGLAPHEVEALVVLDWASQSPGEET